MRPLRYLTALLTVVALFLLPLARAQTLQYQDITPSRTTDVYPFSINGAGQVVGTAVSDDYYSYFGILWLPSDAYGLPAGIYDIGIDTEQGWIGNNGGITGMHFTSGGYRTFVWFPEARYGLSAGAFDLPDPEGIPCSSSTSWSINGQDQAIGHEFRTDNGYQRGFIWQPGSVDGQPMPRKELPIPSIATNSSVCGINETGQVIGSFYTGTNNFGLFWPTADSYVEIDPDRSVIRSYMPRSINIHGQVVGTWQNKITWAEVAFIWDQYSGSRLIGNELGLGYTSSQATDINDAGLVVGTGKIGTVTHVFQWDPVNGALELGALPGNVSHVDQPMVSEDGLVMASVFSGSFRTYLFKAGMSPMQVPTLGGNSVQGWAMNASGQVLAESDLSNGTVHSMIVTLESNQPPTLANPGNTWIPECEPATMQLSAYDPDQGQTLTYSIVNGPSGLSVDPATGLISWTPTEEQGPKTYDVTASVSDGVATASVSFTIQVIEVNELATLVNPGLLTINEGETFTYQLVASDTDVPAQKLTYHAFDMPAGMSLDADTGVLTWTPAEAQGPGYPYVQLYVSDGYQMGGSIAFPIHVNEVNQPPTLTNPSDKTVDEGQQLTVQLTAVDSDLPAQALSYSLVDPPSGMLVSPAGVITWTPSEAQGPGSFPVTAQVSDGVITVPVNFSVHVNETNQPPTLILPVTTFNATVGAQLTFTAQATDPDGGSLTFSLAGAPAEATIDPTTGAFAWTPTSAGTYAFDVKVDDGIAADTKTVTVDVAPPPSSLDVTLNSIVKKGKSILVSLTIRNPGASAVSDVTISSASLGGAATATRVPFSVIKALKAGASKTLTLTFLESSVEGGSQLLVVQGSCSAGDFYLTQTVTTP